MTVHFQLEHHHRYLCGQERAVEPETRAQHGGRCIDTMCAPCEGRRDAVDCPRCIALAREALENLAYFFRADGPHPNPGSASPGRKDVGDLPPMNEEGFIP